MQFPIGQWLTLSGDPILDGVPFQKVLKGTMFRSQFPMANQNASSSVAPVSSASKESKVLGALVVVKCYEGQGGRQIILDHNTVVGLLQAQNYGSKVEGEGEEIFQILQVGKANAFNLLVRTPKGKEGRLIWGDTHAINASHQVDPSFFDLIMGAAGSASFELQVLEMQPTTVKNRRGKKGAPTTLSTDAC